MKFDIRAVDTAAIVARERAAGKGIYRDSRVALETCFVPHANFAAVFDKVVTRIRRNARKSGHQASLLVGGLAGAGKSTLVTKILEAHPRVKDARQVPLRDGSHATCDSVPVIGIKCPEKPQEKMLLKRILKQTGHQIGGHPSRDELKELVDLHLRVLGTQALVVDEAQRPTDRRGTIIAGDIATLFQEIHNEGVVVILVGLGRAEALLKQDTQVGRRWSSPLRLPRYQWGDPSILIGSKDASRLTSKQKQDRSDFTGLLCTLIEEVKLSWASEIEYETEKGAFLFYCASYGLPGQLKKLLLGVIDVAEERGATVITMAILAVAFEEQCRSDDSDVARPNPFEASFQPVLPRQPPDDRATLHARAEKALLNAASGATKAAKKKQLHDALSPA